MQNSKLIALLQTFDGEDFRRFKVFLESPYYNNRTILVDLFHYLRQQSPGFLPENLEKEVLIKRVFKNEIDEKQLHYEMNYLLKLAEQFIGLRHYEKQAFMADIHVVEAYLERKLDKHYHFLQKKLVKQQSKISVLKINDYYQQYQLSDIANQYYLQHQVRKFDPALQSASDDLDVYYIANRLKYLCQMLNRNKIFKKHYTISFSEQILEMAALPDFQKVPLIALYYQIALMFTQEESDQAYLELKKLFDQYFPLLGKLTQLEILSYALNYCVRRVRTSNRKTWYLQETLNLYMWGIDSEMLLSDNVLSPWHFKNIIKAAFNLKQYEWVGNFIKNYYQKLEPSFQEDALNYNLADLYFHQKDYGQAIQYLYQVQQSDIHYALGAKVMLMKIYYEKDEEEALLSLIASFSIYLSRNKHISNDLRKTYQNFCLILNRILRRNPKKREKILKDIKTMPLLTSRNWLLDIVGK